MTDAQPFEVPSLDMFKDDSLKEFVMGIRDRRLIMQRLKEEAERLKQEKQNERNIVTLEKQLNIFERERVAMDKKWTKMVERMNRILSLLLMLDVNSTEVREIIRLMETIEPPEDE